MPVDADPRPVAEIGPTYPVSPPGGGLIPKPGERVLARYRVDNTGERRAALGVVQAAEKIRYGASGVVWTIRLDTGHSFRADATAFRLSRESLARWRQWAVLATLSDGAPQALSSRRLVEALERTAWRFVLPARDQRRAVWRALDDLAAQGMAVGGRAHRSGWSATESGLRYARAHIIGDPLVDPSVDPTEGGAWERAAAAATAASPDPGTHDMVRFGTLGRRRKLHFMRSVLSGAAGDMGEPMLCGATSGGLARVVVASEHRALAHDEGRICACCLRRLRG